MKIPSIKELISAKLLLPGLVFFGVNFQYSYMFYQVNSFKIFLIALGVTIIAVFHDLIFPRNADAVVPFRQILLVSLPLLATIPGYFWHGGNHNYNFNYELTTNLVLILWVFFLIRGVGDEHDLKPFLFLICITMIYAGLWAVLEKIGYHPLSWNAIPADRVKSTFGNVNYFAGFLVVLLPIFLVLAIPAKEQLLTFRDSLKKGFSREIIFYLAVLLLAVISLLLTETRAALAATIISVTAVLFLSGVTFLPALWQKRLVMLFIGFFVLGCAAIAVLYFVPEILKGTRFADIFTLKGWSPRLVSWQAAVNSILASPIIGFGLGSSYNLYFQFADPNARLYWNEHSYNHVHSEILEYIQESGVIGLIVFLLFWGYLTVKLIKLTRSTQASPFVKKIAIGVLGGFIGFHLHGAFSVAPRMIVMKLPLFTLIGIAFILFKISESGREFTFAERFPHRLRLFAPSLVILLLVWYLYIPWMIGQYHFVRIQQQRPSLLKVERMEEMVEEHPDAYALDFLSHMQIQYRRAEQLQKTVEKIDQVLPHYRELGHTKAVLAVLQGNLGKAKKQAQKFQNEQDRYFKPTIHLLLGLSIDTNDFELFKNQMELFVRKLIFESGLYHSLEASDVEVGYGETKAPFSITTGENSFNFQWNENVIKSIFNFARQIRINRSFENEDRNRFVSNVAMLFSSQPYFKLKIKDEYQSEAAKINEAMKTYFSLSEELQKKTSELRGKHNVKLARTDKDDRPAQQKENLKEMRAMAKPYQDEIETQDDYLSSRSDWKSFVKKRDFVRRFINELIAIVFPRTN